MAEKQKEINFNNLVSFFQNQFNAIRHCLEGDYLLGSCILLYSTIDTLAALNRPIEDENVTQKHFKEWCDTYLIKFLTVHCSGEDLYGARCGILHTAMAESSVSRKGMAKQIYYFSGPFPKEIIEYTNEYRRGTEFLTIDLKNFIQAMEKATCEFFVAVKEDLSKIELIENRRKEMLTLGKI